MGSDIKIIDNRNIKIYGKSELVGKEVIATDLRAGACLRSNHDFKSNTVTTVIKDIEHVLRGYEI